jgi:hypothetical protein
MAINCCDIDSMLRDFPSLQREELRDVFCKILAQQPSLSCESVKECETLTSISQIALNGSTLYFTYFDETGEANLREIDLVSLIPDSEYYTFRNGLGESALGIVEFGEDPLLHNTTLDTAGYEFHITGSKLFFDNITSVTNNTGTFTPVNFLYTGTDGKLYSSPLSLLDIDAQNGLTKTGNTIELGGIFLHDTNIDGEYSLHLTQGQLMVTTSVFPQTAVFVKVGELNDTTGLQASASTTVLTNGAFVNTVEGAFVGSYGALNVSFTGDVTLLNEIPYSGSLGYLITRTSDNVNVGVLSALGTRINVTQPGIYDRMAGLHLTPVVSVPYGEDVAFNGTIDEYSAILINNTLFDINAGSITKKYAIRQEGDESTLFDGHVTISTYNDPESSAAKIAYPLPTDRPRLSVSKSGVYTNVGINVAADISLSLLGGGDDTMICDYYAGTSSVLFWEYNTDQALTASHRFSGIIGTIVYESDGDTSGAILSSLSTDAVLLSQTVGTQGSLESYAGLRVHWPKQSIVGYNDGKISNGITNSYGIYIEDQKSDLYLPITNSWGIYQVGVDDTNYFNARVGIKTNTPDVSLHVIGSILSEDLNNHSSHVAKSYSSTGHTGSFQAYSARGTYGAENYLQTGDVSGEFIFRSGNYTLASPWNGRGPGAGLLAYASENHNSTSFGVDLQLRVIPNTDVEEQVVMDFYNSGNVSVGLSGSATSKQIFQVNSTTKGSRPAPAMTTTERDAMGTVSGGTMIYNTTTEEYQYYKLSTNVWISL